MSNRVLNTPHGEVPEIKEAVIANSETIQIGDFIRFESGGVCDIDATTEDICGMAVDIVDNNGISLDSPTKGTVTGTWTASSKQYAAASDNETVDGVRVRFVPATSRTVFLVKMDAADGTSGTAKIGKYYQILTSDASQIDESTISETETSMQFQIADENGLGATNEIGVKVVLRQDAV